MWSRTFAAVLALSACGGPEEEAVSQSEIVSPSDRVIIWQQNIEGMKAGRVAARHLTDAMLAHPFPPDIVIMQEAWQRVLCGDYRADAPIDNFRDSLRDAKGLAFTCSDGGRPRVGSVLHRLGTI